MPAAVRHAGLPVTRYPDINVTAGTAVQFVWHAGSAMGVSGIPSRFCPQDFNASNVVQLAPVTDGGDYTTPPLAPGDHFFACPVRNLI